MISGFVAMLTRSCQRYKNANTITRNYQIHKKKIHFPAIIFCPQSVTYDLSVSELDIKWIQDIAYEIELLSKIFDEGFRVANYAQKIKYKKLEFIKIVRCAIDTIGSKKIYTSDYINYDFDGMRMISCDCKNRLNKIKACEIFEEKIIRDDDQLKRILTATVKEMDVYFTEEFKLDTSSVYYAAIVDIIEEVLSVYYKGIPIENKNVFQKSYTKFGSCLKFSLNFTKTISDEKKLAYSAGINQGLTLLILLSEKLYTQFSFPYYDGMRITIIANDEPNSELWEQFANDWIFVPFNAQVNINFKAKQTSLLPTDRGQSDVETCVYQEPPKVETLFEYIDNMLLNDPTPPKLKNFEKYSQKKCIFECFMDEIIKEFNCVPIYIKYYSLYPNITVCSHLLNHFIENHLQELLSSDNLCKHCKPTCTSNELNIESSHSKYTQGSNQSCTLTHNKTGTSICHRVSNFNIYYKELTVEYQQENFEFTIQDLVTSIGGYFGLFLGASILSVFELFGCCIAIFLPRRIYSQNEY